MIRPLREAIWEFSCEGGVAKKWFRSLIVIVNFSLSDHDKLTLICFA